MDINIINAFICQYEGLVQSNKSILILLKVLANANANLGASTSTPINIDDINSLEAINAEIKKLDLTAGVTTPAVKNLLAAAKLNNAQSATLTNGVAASSTVGSAIQPANGQTSIDQSNILDNPELTEKLSAISDDSKRLDSLMAQRRAELLKNPDGILPDSKTKKVIFKERKDNIRTKQELDYEPGTIGPTITPLSKFSESEKNKKLKQLFVDSKTFIKNTNENLDVNSEEFSEMVNEECDARFNAWVESGCPRDF